MQSNNVMILKVGQAPLSDVRIVARFSELNKVSFRFTAAAMNKSLTVLIVDIMVAINLN